MPAEPTRSFSACRCELFQAGLEHGLLVCEGWERAGWGLSELLLIFGQEMNLLHSVLTYLCLPILFMYIAEPMVFY